ncbi:MAG: FeoB-associated Cys-rich membrane protein [Lachnospiraceae bacterium]|nr:FeoB-associated Cys-rich membrane protein [Lachnospiraceae bacterium]
MSPIIGNIIVIAILAVVIFFAARATYRELKREVSGQGCSGCTGGSCSSCASASKNIDRRKLREVRKWQKQYRKDHRN